MLKLFIDDAVSMLDHNDDIKSLKISESTYGSDSVALSSKSIAVLLKFVASYLNNGGTLWIKPLESNNILTIILTLNGTQSYISIPLLVKE